MKKIISLTLAALMLVTLLVTATSCEVSMEGTTGYTRLRDHVIDTVGQNNELALDGSAMGFSAVRLVAPIEKSETKVNEVYLVADGGSQNALFRLTLKLTDSTEKAQLTYQVINIAQQKLLYGAEATVLLTHYTGNDLVEFTSVTNIHPEDEQTYREAVTSMLNSALKVLDTGSGIPDYALSRIFERFYSLPRANGQKSSGLGLAFVSEVARLFNGEVTLRNVQEGGVLASLRLHRHFT